MNAEVLSGYQTIEKLHESSSTLVVRALHKAEGRPVVLKMFKEIDPPPERIGWFQQEYETTRSLRGVEGIVEAVGLREEQHRWVMLLEDFGGFSLSTLYGKSGVSVEDFLDLAISITEILIRIHGEHLIHKDLNPSNICLNPQKGEIRIIDFGLSTRLSLENPTLGAPSELEGTLAYISPEQTGRMNRPIDSRTDLYSLGVTFYQLLAGRLPFASEDPLEVIHGHLAVMAEPPHLLESGKPSILSRIIQKLMAKNSEERYQTAGGLLNDLLEAKHVGLEAEPFVLGKRDVPDRLQLPQKLYGREQERARLLEAFDRVAEGGNELVLISGYSGIGKTALAHEVARPMTRRRGYFITGKFDQLERDVPYAPFFTAFRSLATQLLTESKERVEQWRQRLTRALGGNIPLVLEMIPELEPLLGQSPSILRGDTQGARNRLHRVWNLLLPVFARKEHPLVLFLDDLQWVDGDSLELLESLWTSKSIPFLLLIATYRDHEVTAGHPLAQMLDRIHQSQAQTTDPIQLRPLQIPEVRSFLGDALGVGIGEVDALAELLFKKSGGNPFFLGELLKHLVVEQFIFFDSKIGRFTWQLSAIEDCDATENVIDLLVERINKLSSEARRALTVASCIGNRFQLDTAAMLTGLPLHACSQALWEALEADLLQPLDPQYRLTELSTAEALPQLEVSYRFSHDRIQQACYSLVDLEERPAIHFELGNFLWRAISRHEQHHRMFEIVDPLMLGGEKTRQSDHRIDFAQLHLLAGQKAVASAAYESAWRYLLNGIVLLVPSRLPVAPGALPPANRLAEGWENEYPLSMALFNQAAEVACLLGRYEEMGVLLQEIRRHARSLQEKVESYRIEIQSYGAQRQLLDGIDAGLEILQELGVHIPREPTSRLIEEGFEEIEALSSDRQSITGLIDASPMEETEKIAAMEVLSQLYIPSYNSAPQVFVLVVLNQVRLTLLHGVTSSSARGLVAYALLLCTRGRVRDGYRFGSAAVDLAQHREDHQRSCTIFMFNHFIRHWSEGVANTLDSFMKGYRIGLDMGDFEFAGLNLVGRLAQGFWAGKELTELAEEATSFSRIASDLNQEMPFAQLTLLWQTIENLQGNSSLPTQLTGAAFNEEKSLRSYIESDNFNMIASVHLLKLQLSYLFGAYEVASESAAVAAAHSAALTGTMSMAVFQFYASLTWLQRSEEVPAEERILLLTRAAEYTEYLRVWARDAPANFEHKVHLIEAEQARIEGRSMEARDLYDQAIAKAHQNGFTQETALALELASRFSRHLGYLHSARSYLRDAHYAYQRWGASAKARQLVAEFPQDLSSAHQPPSHRPNSQPSSFSHSSQQGGESFDLASVFKASQALSGEISLDRLLEKLLKTVLENAGSERALLILHQEGEWLVQAEGSTGTTPWVLLQGIPLKDYRRLSRSIVNRVLRTGEAEILANAAEELESLKDPYIQRCQPKSLLCMPLVHQGHQTALLYLENNLVTNAFTRERIELLSLLSAEMAIAITNAQLYGELEEANRTLEAYSQTLQDKVADRTAELAERNSQLRTTLEQLHATQQQLIQREKMASLGDLTAGIAHEIRNPLNLVSNFAYLNLELASDLEKEMHSWIEDPEPERLEEIHEVLGDLSANTTRIMNHGKRANSIVDGMLLYTRSADSNPLPTDLNQLLRSSAQLAFHHLSVPDSATAPILQESYDESLEAIDLIPSEMTRALVNLLENSIQASLSSPNGRRPEVRIMTQDDGNQVIVSIGDNGAGIPEAIHDKVFEPFFTTKAPGDGVGLGLSISYDIVVHNHRGQLWIHSGEPESTELRITLPKRTDKEEAENE